jgi:diguanylate cyclase (GGDEF)-like protein
MLPADTNEACAPSAAVLGRLLVTQQALDALPDEETIASFVRQALAAVPGVKDAFVHLPGATVPPTPELALLLERCEQERRHAPALAPDAATGGVAGARDFPIETPMNKFGILLVQVADEAALRPFVPFLGNISNTISRVLETRLYQSELANANEELRQARDELEARVAERTRALEFQVTHDQLTGLANRPLLVDRLHQAVTQAQRSGRMIGVVYLDLDAFTFVNTGLGNACGDRLLKEMASRLCSLVRGGDTVARIGSDEFVLLLTELDDAQRSSARLRAVLAAVREPAQVDGKDVVLTCSIGACFYPLDGTEPELLLRRANSAMHRAKESGKDNLKFYADGRDAPIAERMALETELRQSIPDGLVVHYQPKLELASGRLVGAEALLRWEHPKRGLLPPSLFVPMAEESTLITLLGERVLMQACLQARGAARSSVAVNLAARQFRDKRTVDTVRNVLRDTGLEPGRLELEITESSVMHDVPQMTRRMHELKELGVKISIDDFGTGYSSLSVLRNFPIDKLKIDRAFVNEIETVPNAAAVALAVLSFAKSLGMRVIAEGVETAGQAHFLAIHGCDEIQGYLISPPLPAEQLQGLWNKEFTLPPPSPRAAADGLPGAQASHAP